MRSRSVLTALVALSAGVAATAAVRRFVGRRRAPLVPAAAPAVAPVGPVAVGVEAVREAVVLPFTRPVAAAPEQPSMPARCGENGGRTKAGTPCAARATSGGRCHHHRIAA
jgi:hypothetical protein